MADVQDLIARLEKLDGPDREVDAEIYAALWPAYEPTGRAIGEMRYRAGGHPFQCPAFTADITAAALLLDVEYNRAIALCIAALRARSA